MSNTSYRLRVWKGEVDDVGPTRDLLDKAADELDALTMDRARALSALWQIRMAAERWTEDTPPHVFANQLVHIALSGMGVHKGLAQSLLADGVRPLEPPCVDRQYTGQHRWQRVEGSDSLTVCVSCGTTVGK